MNKCLKLLLYILSLYIAETILCFLLFVAEHKYKGYNGWGMQRALRDTFEVNGMRIIFYGIPHIIFFILIITAYSLHKTLYAALINCALYIGLSLIVGAMFGVLEYFTRSFFYFLVISTFVSPFILTLFKFRLTGIFNNAVSNLPANIIQ